MSENARPLRQPGLIVYGCGIATSLIAIWVVSRMQDHGENPMGWYANGIIPVGAFLVGLASGLGYAIASYFLNVKLSKPFVMFMLLTACLDYASMQFVIYSDLVEKAHVNPAAYTFVQWFREATEGMVFKRSSSTEAGGELGMWGYGYRLLELIGFAGGVASPCGVVLGQAYCRSCQKYLKRHYGRTVSSPVLIEDWKKVPKKERPQFLENAITGLIEELHPLLQSLQAMPLDEVRPLLDSTGGPKAVKNTLCSVSIMVRKCPLCDSHHITATLTNMTNDRKVRSTVIMTSDKPAWEPDLKAA